MKAKYLGIVALMLSSALYVSAQGQGQGHGQGKGKNKDTETAEVSDANHHGVIIFTPREREIITNYYHHNYSNLPPGLAKRNGKLPPGLEKQLKKNGQLPPGLQKRLTPFPEDLERRLPRLPDIYQRGSIGSSVVILDRKTQRILDVINDIIRP